MPSLEWATTAEQRAEAARFFARVITADPAYISHGEIQAGLSPDGKTWAADLESMFLQDVAEDDLSFAIALARGDDGPLIGAAILLIEESERLKFGVLADLAVDPARRSSGLGEALSAFVDAEAKRRGCAWMFLESGKNNRRAHAFFERHGYEEISHVFGKKL